MWWGHSTVSLHHDGVHLLTDPLLTDRVAHLTRRRGARPVQERVDAVLVSHLHHDHLHLPSLRRLPPGTRVVVPRGGGGLLDRLDLDVVEVEAGQSVAVGAVTVRAVRAFHDGRRHPGSSWSAPALGYVVHGSLTSWFAGDTGWNDHLGRDVGRCDLALLPVGGWGPVSRPSARGQHLTPVEAAVLASRHRPGLAVPIHYGTMWPLGLPAHRHAAFRTPGDAFAEHVQRLAADQRVQVLPPGGELWPGQASADGDLDRV